MTNANAERLGTLVGRRVALPGHFEGDVVMEAARTLGAGVELRVRLLNGELNEAVLPAADVERLLEHSPATTSAISERMTDGRYRG